jgi:hypothetical protein
MWKPSKLAHAASAPSATLVLATFIALAAGCGSSGDDPPPPPVVVNPPVIPPTAIEGIATPSSVAVVTATNAD